jgi:hypothetical protein
MRIDEVLGLGAALLKQAKLLQVGTAAAAGSQNAIGMSLKKAGRPPKGEVTITTPEDIIKQNIELANNKRLKKYKDIDSRNRSNRELDKTPGKDQGKSLTNKSSLDDTIDDGHKKNRIDLGGGGRDGSYGNTNDIKSNRNDGWGAVTSDGSEHTTNINTQKTRAKPIKK